MLPCSRLIDSERSAASVSTRLSVTWFSHLTISETARRAPAVSPALRNSAILSCFSFPEIEIFSVSGCGPGGGVGGLWRVGGERGGVSAARGGGAARAQAPPPAPPSGRALARARG